MGTLSGWGAGYPEEKARRLGPGFCRVGSRVFQEVWVTDFACLWMGNAARERFLGLECLEREFRPERISSVPPSKWRYSV